MRNGQRQTRLGEEHLQRQGEDMRPHGPLGNCKPSYVTGAYGWELGDGRKRDSVALVKSMNLIMGLIKKN